MLSKTLGALLKKDWDERFEDDKLIIERILILVRNILQVTVCLLWNELTRPNVTYFIGSN